MNADFAAPPMGCMMGYIDEAGVEHAGPPAPVTPEPARDPAAIITPIFDLIGKLGTTAMTVFGQQPATAPAIVTAPGAAVPTAQYPRPAGMDPMMLIAIGGVALVAVAMMRPRRRS